MLLESNVILMLANL